MNIVPTDIAARINEQHELAYGKAREAIEHARRCGELLIEAKAKLQHGEWLPWLQANCRFSERTAQGYMRLARDWDKLQAKSATVADLGLRDALGLLAEPKTEPDESPFEAAVHFIRAGNNQECRSALECWKAAAEIALAGDDLREINRIRLEAEQIHAEFTASIAAAEREWSIFMADMKAQGWEPTRNLVPARGYAHIATNGDCALHIVRSSEHPGYCFMTRLYFDERGELSDVAALERPVNEGGVSLIARELGLVGDRKQHRIMRFKTQPWPRNFFLEGAAA